MFRMFSERLENKDSPLLFFLREAFFKQFLNKISQLTAIFSFSLFLWHSSVFDSLVSDM